MKDESAQSGGAGRALIESIRGAWSGQPILDGPGRQKVREAITEGARLDAPYLLMTSLAALVAALGLLQDSTAVVIGAMILAMLLGPISGLALAMVEGLGGLLRRSLIALGLGSACVLAIGVVAGRVFAGIPLTDEMLARTAPNMLDLLIALAGGAAGAYASISSRVSAGAVGVAIATALVPPLTTAGLCWARGEWLLGAGAFVLFATNLIAIQFSTSFVLWMHGHRGVLARGGGSPVWVRSHAISFGLLLVLTGAFAVHFRLSLHQVRSETAVRAAIEKGLQEMPGAALVELEFLPAGESTVIDARVRAPVAVSPSKVRLLESGLPRDGGPWLLKVRTVLTRDADRNGWLYDVEP